MHLLAYGLSYIMWAAWRLTAGVFLPSGLAASFVMDTAVKAAIWIGPILFVMCRNRRELIPLRHFFRTPFPWFPTLSGLCLSAAFLHTAHVFLSGIDTWGIFRPMWICLALSAAVIEEIAFRGLLFNGQALRYGSEKAAIMNGALFAIYHYPEFIVGQNLTAVFGLRFWVITVMGVVFSLTFAKWKNLTMNMVIHFVWNMLCFWFALT